MMFHSGIKQAFRTPRRLVAYFLVTAIVCTFLCIGLNLDKIAAENLSAVINNFNVVAYPNFQAHITIDGSLSTDTMHLDSIGYYPCWAEHYGIEQLSTFPGVKNIDMRNQFGGYVSDETARLAKLKDYYGNLYCYSDVVIFELSGEKPVTVTGYLPIGVSTWEAKQVRYPVNIHWSAAGKDTSVSTVVLLNASFNTYDLVPGKLYIMKTGYYYDAWTDPYHNSFRITADDTGLIARTEDEAESLYHPIYEYTEDFWETDEGRYFKQAAEACMINENSMTVITTNDLAAIPSWNSGKISLVRGRQFTQEEYDSGAKVCLVSNVLANEMEWEIGDTIDFSFYQSVYPFGGNASDHHSTFSPLLYHDYEDVKSGNVDCLPTDHFFDEGTFKIVGFYGGNISKNPESRFHTFGYNAGMDWMNVIIPSNSVANQPEPKLSQYTTSIRLEPLKVQEFLAAAQASGLMDEQQFGYQLGLTVEDHGLSNLASGLESLDQISSLTLMLAAITAVLAVAVLAILHLLQNKKQIASLRSMGVRRGQVAACILSGILLACILGAAVGAFAGQMLSASVTEKIMASAEQDTFDDTFSAMIATYHAYDEYEMTTAADPRLTILAGGSVALALTLLSVALVLHEGKKPPLLTLGVKE